MYHGVDAYSRNKSGIYGLIHRASLVGEVEACWADIPIGPLGVFCDIENAVVAFVTDRDAWSEVDFRGERVTRLSAIFGDNIVYSDNSYDLYRRMKETKKGRYIEICAKGEPDAVWVKNTASDKFKKAARVISRHLSLPLIYV